jgi:hypothetical protein
VDRYYKRPCDKPERPCDEPRYLTTMETAKLIRAALKRSFPTTKFSVRSHVYRGGSSVDVSWTDGPTNEKVDGLVSVYAGKDFDGMIDLEHSVYAWLLPDGSARPAYSAGTQGSAGVHPAFRHGKPSPDAEFVLMGAGYVFTRRQYSSEVFQAAAKTVSDRWGLMLPVAVEQEGYGPYIPNGVWDLEWFEKTGDYPGRLVMLELRDKDLSQ